MSNSSAPFPPLIEPIAPTLSTSNMWAKSFTPVMKVDVVPCGPQPASSFPSFATKVMFSLRPHVERAAAAARRGRDVNHAAGVLTHVGHVAGAAVDRRVALAWVKRHVAGGGAQVRAVGQRAAARSAVESVRAFAAIDQVVLVARGGGRGHAGRPRRRPAAGAVC